MSPRGRVGQPGSTRCLWRTSGICPPWLRTSLRSQHRTYTSKPRAAVPNKVPTNQQSDRETTGACIRVGSGTVPAYVRPVRPDGRPTTSRRDRGGASRTELARCRTSGVPPSTTTRADDSRAPTPRCVPARSPSSPRSAHRSTGSVRSAGEHSPAGTATLRVIPQPARPRCDPRGPDPSESWATPGSRRRRVPKNSAGTSPITRASGTKKLVLARFARNRRLGDALQQWAFCSLGGSPGARGYVPAAPRSARSTTRPRFASSRTASSHPARLPETPTPPTTNTPTVHTTPSTTDIDFEITWILPPVRAPQSRRVPWGVTRYARAVGAVPEVVAVGRAEVAPAAGGLGAVVSPAQGRRGCRVGFGRVVRSRS